MKANLVFYRKVYYNINMRAYKYRIYPDNQQRQKIAQHFGCSRFVYNWGLETKISAYQKDKESLAYFDLANRLKSLKEENPWLKEVDSQSLQMALRNLDNAYTRFFREKKGFPKFHSKQNSRQSYQIPQRCEVLDRAVKIPKLGIVRAKIHRNFTAKAGTWTISKNPSGQYFVSIVTDETPQVKRKSNNQIGIDLGIKTFATCSNGNKISNLKWLRKKSKHLAFVQRQVSHKIKGGQNRRKANLKVAKTYQKIVNQREDWQHKWSAKLVSENQVICLEDLSVSNMLKNHSLARSIQECAWSSFVSKLEYKAEWYGTQIVKIGRFEPSSKICSCGEINHELTLADRVWTCKKCGQTHDRDLLASQNILKFGMNLISGRDYRIKPVELPELSGAMKQEAQSL